MPKEFKETQKNFWEYLMESAEKLQINWDFPEINIQNILKIFKQILKEKIKSFEKYNRRN